MNKIYVLLSGEHPTIPAAEIRAILEAENIGYSIVKEYVQMLTITVEDVDRTIHEICRRSAMAKECGVLLFEVEADIDSIIGKLKEIDWSFLREKTFAVRIKRIGVPRGIMDTTELERLLGAKILSFEGKSKVRLEEPNFLFRGFIINGKFLFGIRLGVVDRGAFDKRRPKRRPFFHPSAMEPRLSRAFVNLARTRRGEIFLDPYCGTGGFLIEAALIGAKVVGGDIKEEMVRGSILNLRYFGIKEFDVILHDARKLPFININAIATDPPYGRSATTMRIALPRLIEEFLFSASDSIVKGGYICIASPYGINVEDYAKDAGLELIEEHSMRVHRSLIRRIIVLRR
ncbi:MAG: TIGR01177 family methyltransferase [Thermoprotei archaeon]|nr:MAG: TIGR01177 family methyltransferase [Thermoprotei archaeon]